MVKGEGGTHLVNHGCRLICSNVNRLAESILIIPLNRAEFLLVG